MNQKFAHILYKLIIFLDIVYFFITKKHLRFYLYDYLREKYINVKINDKKY